METDFQITQFDASHAKECANIIRRSIEASHAEVYTSQEVANVLTEYSIEKLIAKSVNRRTYLLKAENKLAAVGTVKENEIKCLYVDSNLFRKGFGAYLLSFLEQTIKSAGYDTAQLFASLNSVDFYRKQGYEFVRLHKDANGPAQVLRKRLGDGFSKPTGIDSKKSYLYD